ncbi:MFS transporter [Microvirga makkahensis]|uniref:MFS transporter n=1 Tax=Microvirga makkahensis TaxID=1128670 RepID=A0A7X3MW28_9HYPH|nr:MFS transporter [Microvirga makkahensis]MXQ14251.1 MFS transporter [Microvirga makkahensis]
MSAVRNFGSPAAVVLGVGGLYVGQSIISGMTFSALPSVLRDRGLPLDRIGLVYLAVLPWVLKFLWAPALERYRLPATGPSRSRSIVLAGGMISAASLVLVGLIGPNSLAPLMAVLVVIAFAASTVDIACDGHAVESLSERHHGWGNAAQVGGAYIGAAIGSGLFLVLVDRFDWTGATLAMAVLIVLLGLPFLLSPARAPAAPRTHQPSLRDALRRSDMRKGLALAAVYTLTQKWGLSMIGPFLVDRGFDLSSLGVINGVGGLAIGFACALLGGAMVRAWGARAVLVIALVLQAGALVGLAVAAWSDGIPRVVLLGLALASSSAVMALGYVALYAHFMALSDPRQAGIDFTLLQCMDALVSMVGGVGAGWIAQHFGYGAFFGIAGALAAAAVPAGALLSRRSTDTGEMRDGMLLRQRAS